jgi:hypothetical protein
MTNGILFIGSCKNESIQNLNQFPNNIQIEINNYLKKKVGEKYFKELEYSFGTIYTNENSECYETYNYPVYSLGYELDFKELGLNDFPLFFIIDNKGKIIDQAIFPKIVKENLKRSLITLDSIYSLVKKKNIPSEKLNIEFNYNKKNKAYLWKVKTYLNDGINGLNCIPEYKCHFNINALSGELFECN